MISAILRRAALQTRLNLRIIGAAWLLNVLLALLLAVPFLNQLDRALAPTAREEELVRSFDVNWYRTWQFDNEANPLARMFDASTFGAAPFIHHLDGMVSGTTLLPVVRTVQAFLPGLRIDPSRLSLLILLALLYAFGSAFLAGGFLSVYAAGLRATTSEFIADGTRYFGRMVRIMLVGFILVGAVVALGAALSGAIAERTANDPSEWTPYVLHLCRNGLLLVLLWCVGIGLDYGRVRMVLDERRSAVFAVGAGFRFAAARAGRVVGVSVAVLALVGILMGAAGYALEEMNASSYGTIALVFVVQQLFVAARMGVRAFGYAGVVEVARER